MVAAAAADPDKVAIEVADSCVAAAAAADIDFDQIETLRRCIAADAAVAEADEEKHYRSDGMLAGLSSTSKEWSPRSR